MIDVPERGEPFHEMWGQLIRLADDAPVPWILIGAHMVALHGWREGMEPIRESRDADVLVHARAVSGAVSRLSRHLLGLGFEFTGISRQGIGHRFTLGSVRLDLLAPDGLGERTGVETIRPARTVRVPGGTQALARAERIEVRSREVTGSVSVPNLLGAILLKARAIAVDDQPDAQREDLAFLCSLVEDPQPLVESITRSERAWLRRHREIADPSADCWTRIPSRENGALVFRRLT